MSQNEQMPLEIYMEGNVVFRQGERVIYASSMYYDVPNRIGTVLDADMLTDVPKYEGLLRLHAQILQQSQPGAVLGPGRLSHVQPAGGARLSPAIQRRHLRGHNRSSTRSPASR